MQEKKIRGALIAQYRKERGFSQKELGEKIGLTGKTVSAWESGRSTPGIRHSLDISKALNVNVAQLMVPMKENEKEKEELCDVINSYQSADDLTKEMVRRILKVKSRD